MAKKYRKVGFLTASREFFRSKVLPSAEAKAMTPELKLTYWLVPNKIYSIEQIMSEGDRVSRKLLRRWILKEIFLSSYSDGIISWDKINEAVDRLTLEPMSPSKPEIKADLLIDSIRILWSLSKNIFLFDKSLYEGLLDTEPSPFYADTFTEYPYWSTYIEIPREPMVWLSHDCLLIGVLITNTSALHGIPTDENYKHTFVMESHLIDTVDNIMFTIREQVFEDKKNGTLHVAPSNLKGWKDPSKERLQEQITRTSIFVISMNLLMFIQVYLRNIYNENQHNKPNAILGKVKKGKVFEWIPAKKRTIWKVGEIIGEQLRNAVKSEGLGGTHASPSPHIRRAHWHTYLTGPAKGIPKDTRARLLKWIPPLPIAMYRDEKVEGTP